MRAPPHVFDVVWILKKARQEHCTVEAEAERAPDDPKIFTRIQPLELPGLSEGSSTRSPQVERAVKLSKDGGDVDAREKSAQKSPTSSPSTPRSARGRLIGATSSMPFLSSAVRVGGLASTRLRAIPTLRVGPLAAARAASPKQANQARSCPSVRRRAPESARRTGRRSRSACRAVVAPLGDKSKDPCASSTKPKSNWSDAIVLPRLSICQDCAAPLPTTSSTRPRQVRLARQNSAPRTEPAPGRRCRSG